MSENMGITYSINENQKKNLHSQDNPVSFITMWNGINNIIAVAEVDQQKQILHQANYM